MTDLWLIEAWVQTNKGKTFRHNCFHNAFFSLYFGNCRTFSSIGSEYSGYLS